MKTCGSCTHNGDLLLNAIDYDPNTGMFRWKSPIGRQAKGWFKGNKGARKYRRIWWVGRHYMAHVVAWAKQTGVWPDYEIDHRDKDQGNNVFTNLRPATRAQQNQNRGIGKANKTGVKGVSQYGHRFRATIGIGGKKLSLGLFDTVAEAAAARKGAEKVHHGDYAG